MTPRQAEKGLWYMQVFRTVAVALLLGIGGQTFIWIKYIHQTVTEDHNTVIQTTEGLMHAKNEIQELQKNDAKQNIFINTLLTEIKYKK